jgi:hypothetical protein
MSENKRFTPSTWVDPDDAPALTTDFFSGPTCTVITSSPAAAVPSQTAQRAGDLERRRFNRILLA